VTGPEHYREAERLAEQAAGWMDAYTGWKAGLSTDERLARRAADLAEAQVHASLALAAATGLNAAEGGMPPGDWVSWRDAAGATS
jgi:hypothetical protein